MLEILKVTRMGKRTWINFNNQYALFSHDYEGSWLVMKYDSGFYINLKLNSFKNFDDAVEKVKELCK